MGQSRDEIVVPMERLIVAPMPGLQSSQFIQTAVALGLSMPIHRFNTPQEQKALLYLAINTKKLINSNSKLWVSVGLRDWKERIGPIKNIMREHEVGVLLDVANGFSKSVKDTLADIYNTYEIDNLFGGNIHTTAGFDYMERSGAKFIRCGIANGGVCSTKDATGVLRGQISTIKEIFEGRYEADIVCDGGIKGPADLSKAFLAGADYCMLGSVFSKASEAQCNQDGSGIFYGGASAKAKTMAGLEVRYVEGKEVAVDKTEVESLTTIVETLTDGLKSAISYSGFSSLEEAIGNGTFEIVK